MWPQKIGLKRRYQENWKEHLHCHKQSLSPSSADIFRPGIVFHYLPFMDGDERSGWEELPHLERFTSCLNSVSHLSKAFVTQWAGVWMSHQHEYIEDRLSQHQRLTRTVASLKRQKGWELTKSSTEPPSLTSLCFCGLTAVVFWRTIFAACVVRVVAWSHLTHRSLKFVCFFYFFLVLLI